MIVKRKLYSFLSYRLFAKKDYDKFNRKGQEILTSNRNSLAEDTAKLLKQNKRDLQESIKYRLANNTSGLSEKDIIAHETEIYNANNKQLLQQLKNKKLKGEIDANLKSQKIWGKDSGKAVGDERKRINDQIRKIMDRAYDGRDSKGIRLELKKRVEDRKNQKAQNLRQGQLGNVKGGLRKLEKDELRKSQDALVRTEAGINKDLIERTNAYKQRKADAANVTKQAGHRGNEVGMSRKKRLDVARRSRDAASRDSKGISLDLKNRYEAYKQQKTIQPTSSTTVNNLPAPTNTNATPTSSSLTIRTRGNIKRRSSIFNNSLNPMRWSKGAKIGAGIGASAALIGTGVYLHNKNKKD